MRELLEIGKRGMFANQKSLEVVGQNVANANTPGYSRQRVELEAIEFRLEVIDDNPDSNKGFALYKISPMLFS